jgi:hypothetical protein
MKQLNYAKGMLLLCFILAFLVGPAQAFSVDSLTIDINQDGNALITFHYTLSKIEHTAVYLNIVDPGKELKSALEGMYHHNVTVNDVSETSAQFLMSDFATTSTVNNTTTMSTPEISFQGAQKLLDKYWFASLVQVNYAPGTTTLTYPDGYNVVYYDQIDIPKTKHELPTK